MRKLGQIKRDPKMNAAKRERRAMRMQRRRIQDAIAAGKMPQIRKIYPMTGVYLQEVGLKIEDVLMDQDQRSKDISLANSKKLDEMWLSDIRNRKSRDLIEFVNLNAELEKLNKNRQKNSRRIHRIEMRIEELKSKSKVMLHDIKKRYRRLNRRDQKLKNGREDIYDKMQEKKQRYKKDQ